MKKILFVTLFDLTQTYIQLGKALELVGYKVHYIASTKHSADLIRANNFECLDLSITRKNIKYISNFREILSAYESDRLTIFNILEASRIYYGENENITGSYLADVVQKIEAYIQKNNIKNVVAEPTDAIQLLTQLVCWKNNIGFFQISLTRYPTNRIMLNNNCFEEDLYRLTSNMDDKTALRSKSDPAMNRPAYYDDALKYKHADRLGRSAIKRLLGYPMEILGLTDFNVLKTNYLIGLHFRNQIRRMRNILLSKRDSAFKIEKKYYLYYLHVQPERSIDVISPKNRNQLENIRLIRATLPYDCILIVKDHPASDGAQSYGFYRELASMSGVKLANQFIDSQKLGEKAEAIFTVSGTIGIEMAFLNKPVMVFSNIFYKVLENVYIYKSIEDLKEFILTKKVKQQTYGKFKKEDFLEIIKTNSVETSWLGGAGPQSSEVIQSFVKLIDLAQNETVFS